MTYIKGILRTLTFINDATVNFCDVYRGLVSITMQCKTELTHIEATYIKDSLYLLLSGPQLRQCIPLYEIFSNITDFLCNLLACELRDD